MALERMGVKSAGNVLRNIAKSKENPLPRVISALGIRFVGERTAVFLAEAFGSMDALLAASKEQLQAVPDIGPVVAAAVREYLDQPRNSALIKELAAAGLRMDAPMTERVEIVGGTCFKSVLGSERRLPALARGDVVAILDTGMYAEVFANQFNGIPRPATAMVADGEAEVIKRRETIEDLFGRHAVPARLAARAPRHPGSDDVLRWAANGFDA